MTKPSDAPKDSSKEGAVSQNLELVLATLPIPAKEDPMGKGRHPRQQQLPNPPSLQKINL